MPFEPEVTFQLKATLKTTAKQEAEGNVAGGRKRASRDPDAKQDAEVTFKIPDGKIPGGTIPNQKQARADGPRERMSSRWQKSDSKIPCHKQARADGRVCPTMCPPPHGRYLRFVP